ncbi:MAG: hypothetical protein NTV73_08815 [Hyphomicrobiales bacterium]|nr:hypothetical protein [Hyphomicrobiales bacterium]
MQSISGLPSGNSGGEAHLSRNLVVVRAGDTSLHRKWGASEHGCAFDLIVSYFGDKRDAFRAPWEQRVDFQGGKWDGIHHLFASRPALLDSYDYFWFPDDDIEADRRTIEGVFSAMRRLDLAVSQPALSLDSYFSFLPFLKSEVFTVRFVDMVEVMIPCLNRFTLQKMLPLFSTSMSGFGLDLVWTRLLADNRRKCAVLDELPVRHTRPVGGALAAAVASRGRTQADELLAVQSRYDAWQAYPLCYEAIDGRGRRWRSQVVIGARMAADLLLRRKTILQRKHFLQNVRLLLERQALWRPQLAILNVDA